MGLRQSPRNSEALPRLPRPQPLRRQLSLYRVCPMVAPICPVCGGAERMLAPEGDEAERVVVHEAGPGREAGRRRHRSIASISRRQPR